ncbi:MAG: tetratricopeptide repeat protein [Gammaproteobacteria bacterium]
MSLINTMLRDLEERQAFLAANNNRVIDDLQSIRESDAGPHSPDSRLVTTLILVMTLVLATLGYEMVPDSAVSGFFQHQGWSLTPSKSRDQSAAPALENVAVERLRVMPVMEPVAPSKESSGIRLKLAPLDSSWPSAGTNPDNSLVDETGEITPPPIASGTELRSIRLQELAGATAVHIGLSSAPDYRLFVLDNPHRLLIEINDMTMPPDIVKGSYANGMIARLRHTYRGDMALLIFDLKEAVVINSSEVTEEEDGFALHIELMDKHQEQDNRETAGTGLGSSSPATLRENSETDKQDVYKRLHKPPPLKKKDMVFNDAVIAYRAGDLTRTIELLYGVITEHPGHIRARKLLVSVLLEQGDRQSAGKLLSEGLQQAPANTALIKLYAKLLVGENQLDVALNYLNKARPDFEDDPEYYALKAAILQRKGMSGYAAQIYRRLVRVDPHNGIWWMGLGISFEGLGRNGDALQAYKRAQQDSTVASNIARFIGKRISALSG